MEPATREAVTTFWQIAAFLGNSIAFLLIGFEANIITFPQSILIIAAAFLAVTAARAATVYPILAFFRKISGKMSTVWSNIAMLRRRQRSTIHSPRSHNHHVGSYFPNRFAHDRHDGFGVAFVSIMVQVPLLFRYAEEKYPKTRCLWRTDVDEQFELITSHMEEVRKLKSEGKISNEEFTKRIEASKKQLDELINKSPATINTQKIIRTRASALYGSFQKDQNAKNKKKAKKRKISRKSRTVITDIVENQNINHAADRKTSNRPRNFLSSLKSRKTVAHPRICLTVAV